MVPIDSILAHHAASSARDHDSRGRRTPASTRCVWYLCTSEAWSAARTAAAEVSRQCRTTTMGDE